MSPFTSSVDSSKQCHLITTQVMCWVISYRAFYEVCLRAFSVQSSTDKRAPAGHDTPQRQEKGGMKPDEAHYPAYCTQMCVSQGKVKESKIMSVSTGSPVHWEALRAASYMSESGCHTEIELKLREQINNLLVLLALPKDDLTFMRCLDAKRARNKTLPVSELWTDHVTVLLLQSSARVRKSKHRQKK